MQISRHWRMNAIRYRLEGFRTSAEDKTLISRPAPVITVESDGKDDQARLQVTARVATAA